MNEVPLSQRVTAPAEAILEPIAGVSWRPAKADDIDAIVRLNSATSAVDHPTYADTREELLEELGHSYVDLERDSLVGVAEKGDLVAFGMVIFPPGQETLVRSILAGSGVHPAWRGRGIGRALLAWQEARALQQLASSEKTLPGWIMAYADDRATATVRLLKRAGFPATRWFMSMTRVVAEPIPEVEPAGDIRIVAYSPEYSERAHAAKDAAFRDHWGSQPSTDEQWASMVGLEIFAPEHSFVAVTGDDEVVGVLITFVVEDDWERQGYSSGYVAIVGVTREARHRKIAPSLLAANFGSLREAGIERSQLDVDSDNPSGALGLYAGMGYVEDNRSANYAKVY